LEKAGVIKSINKDKGLIYYSLSTESGQSGCPLIFGGTLIGIHNGGNEGRKLNGGRLFD
jgi:hypothetical protein